MHLLDLGEENLLPSRFEVLVTESEAQDDLGVAMAVFGAMVVMPSFPLGQEPVEIELTVFFAGNDGCAASMYEKVEHILSLQQLALFEWTCEISVRIYLDVVISDVTRVVTPA